jgi:carboxymethylenebutenolidase
MCHPDNDRAAGGTASRGSRERWLDVTTAGAQMPMFRADPDRASRGNVVIIHDIYGAGEFYQVLARRLADHGYTAWLPNLFFRQGELPERTREAAFARRERWSTAQAVDDLARTIDVVKQQSEGKVGTVGFCMGGTLVMLTSARDDRIDAGVIYYGFPANAVDDRGERFAPLEEAARIQSPLLGFWGDQDHGVGMDNVDRYRAALQQAGKPFDFTIYPGLPHGFLTFDASSPNYDGSQDSWRQVTAFFGDLLS